MPLCAFYSWATFNKLAILLTMRSVFPIGHVHNFQWAVFLSAINMSLSAIG